MAAVRKWSKDEIKALKKAWPNGTREQVCKALGLAAKGLPARNWDGVKKQAQRLGLKKTKKYMRTVLGRGK